MDVTIGYGRNTKRSPKRATKQCVKMIKSGLKSRYNNKFLLSIISGFKLPKVPEKTEVAIVKSAILSIMTIPLLKFSQKVLQKGFGNEEYILEKLTIKMPEFSLLHVSSTDSMIAKNYQFLNKKILTNSILCLALETDIAFNLEFTSGSERTDIKFKVTKTSKDRRIIKKINDNPAYTEYLRLMKWSKESLETKAIDMFGRFPLAFYKNGRILIRTAGMILRNSLGFFNNFKSEEGFIAHVTIQKIVESIDELFTIDKPEFGLVISCNANQMLLGYKVYELQEKLKKYFEDKPFLLVYGFGEGMYKPGEGLYYLNESTVSAIFGCE
ncbi:MAG: hypothetical protein NTV74_04100 [Euryarchaeota archaeon]|nr:hypothetical protein [Euryarchaeota archaeon]